MGLKRKDLYLSASIVGLILFILFIFPFCVSASQDIFFEPSLSGGYTLESTGEVHPYWRIGLDTYYHIKGPISLAAGAGYAKYHFSYTVLTLNGILADPIQSNKDANETKTDLYITGQYSLFENERWKVRLDLGFRDLLLLNDFKNFNIKGPLAGMEIERYISDSLLLRLKGSAAYDINGVTSRSIAFGKESSILYDPSFLLDYLATLDFKIGFGIVGIGYEGGLINFTFINRYYHGLTLRLLF